MANKREAGLAPVPGRARIDVLDILRGLAILGILFINVPYMAAPVAAFSADVRAIGWSPLDRIAWSSTYLLFSGTQRCVLEFLFGAGMMVLTAKAMEPDGPVAVADLYYRRNLWLLAFGLFDAVVLFWPGDILHIYALAALFLFPFRRLGVGLLLAGGLGWALLVVVGIPEHGLYEYQSRAQLTGQVAHAQADLAAGTPTAQDRQVLADWRHERARLRPQAETRAAIVAERGAHAGGLLPYAEHAWRSWRDLVEGWLAWNVLEAFCTMLIGIVLWKQGVIQGERSRRFYVGLTIAGYGLGLGLRGIGLSEELSFTSEPRTIWFTAEIARIAIGLGHVALINAAVQTRAGSAILAPFRATGRTAFSLYFLQQAIGMWVLFAPWGFDLWGRFGWAAMWGIALVLIAVEVVIANLWMRWFTSGPLEWLWRSLAYVRLMPIRRQSKDAGVAAGRPGQGKLASIPGPVP